MRIGDPLVAEIFFCRFITAEPKRRAICKTELTFERCLRIGLARELDRWLAYDRFDLRNLLPFT